MRPAWALNWPLASQPLHHLLRQPGLQGPEAWALASWLGTPAQHSAVMGPAGIRALLLLRAESSLAWRLLAGLWLGL